MKFGRDISFLVAVVLCGLILHLLPFDQERVAGLRLERQWTERGAWMRNQVLSLCDTLTSQNDTHFERLFLRWAALDDFAAANPRPCSISIQSASASRFQLKTNWAFHLRVASESQPTVLQATFHVDAPRPLALLPLLAFALALLFEVKFYRFAVMLGLYGFLLAGANLLRAVSMAGRAVWHTITVDQTFVGLALVAAWLAVAKARAQRDTSPPRLESKPRHWWMNRGLVGMVGMWSPTIFTMFGKILIPLRGGLVHPFLDAQFAITAVSLYLFTIDWSNLRQTVVDTMLLPRYFTFAVLLLFAAQTWLTPARRQQLVWKTPHFWRALVAVVAVEGLKYVLPWLSEVNSITRFGLALVLSEIVWPKGLPWRSAGKIAAPWMAVIFLGLFATVLSLESGICDLALQLVNPRAHPRVLYLATFVGGVTLGFLTGSFSSAFFTLFAFLQSPHVPLLRAALLDGVLAGLMLSPISLFNLLPAVQFGMSVRKVLLFRFGQLAVPLSIGVLIYAVAAINSVAILRPVTFIFCFLAAMAYQLKKSEWDIRRGTFAPSEHSAASST